MAILGLGLGSAALGQSGSKITRCSSGGIVEGLFPDACHDDLELALGEV